jgi:predicted nucleotidyltransferase component of viral defense system
MISAGLNTDVNNASSLPKGTAYVLILLIDYIRVIFLYYYIMTVRQDVELFHLLFLRQLEGRLDKSLYALKGGCNLRFYFKSIRYSEDIDFDVKTVAKDTLRTKVTKLLESTPFQQILASRKIEISGVSEAKQTETTQRWKITLRTESSSLPIPTKIEFSRRALQGALSFEPIDADLTRVYQLTPILANHYEDSSAFLQKIEALAERSEVQARDVFDLELLTKRKAHEQIAGKQTRPSKAKLSKAIENAMSVSFEQFSSQVVAYLSSEYASYFGSEKAWNEIQTLAVETLEGLL